jgi:hypothetical protein
VHAAAGCRLACVSRRFFVALDAASAANERERHHEDHGDDDEKDIEHEDPFP